MMPRCTRSNALPLALASCKTILQHDPRTNLALLIPSRKCCFWKRPSRWHEAPLVRSSGSSQSPTVRRFRAALVWAASTSNSNGSDQKGASTHGRASGGDSAPSDAAFADNASDVSHPLSDAAATTNNDAEIDPSVTASMFQPPRDIMGDIVPVVHDLVTENHATSTQQYRLSSTGGSTKSTIEDVLFYLFRNDEGKVPVGRFLASLMATGLRRSDPRLQEFFRNLRTAPGIANTGVGDAGSAGFMLDKDTFHHCIKDNIVLISRAFLNEFVVPEFQDFTNIIEEIYWKCRSNTAGKVADYIPQLARFSPDYWGVSICTVDGQRFSIGDSEIPFCLQSASKPLTYVTALEDLGPLTVHEYIGQEPSGRIFNDLVLDANKKPHNPLINAGAILTISLIQRHMKLADRFDYLLRNYKRMAGNEYVGFSNSTFLSERDTADRNYSLGFYMKENHCFPEGSNLQETLDLYFQMCSTEVTGDSGSVIAATLANGGICPTTGEKVMKNSSVRDVLSLMYSCGMYDYSGQFAFNVGLPAKSGVSGTILVVVPNVMGIALWSPPLDHYGNSVRGVQFCQELVSRFNFHNFDNVRHTPRKLDPRARNVEAKGLQIVTLLFSAANGDLTSLRRLFLSGMDMSQGDYDGRTALHLAASEGHLEVVKMLLIKCKVLPHNPRDRWNRTPIDDAKQFGHEDVVQFLTDWDARVGEHPTTSG